MPTLREVQNAVSAFMRGGGGSAAELVIDDGLSGTDRLGIYRNTYVSTLVAALRISYPAVQNLVGADFFEGAARAFIDAVPPQHAYLNDYGAGFGDFLADFASAASLFYLADTARLEWAVNNALHAHDRAALDVARLADVGDKDIAFVAHPSVRVLALAHPADAIWRAVLAGDDAALAAIDPAAGSVVLLVSRGSDGVTVERLSADEAAFTTALFSGAPLSDALLAAPFDMSRPLAAHLAAGRLIDFRIMEKTGT